MNIRSKFRYAKDTPPKLIWNFGVYETLRDASHTKNSLIYFAKSSYKSW